MPAKRQQTLSVIIKQLIEFCDTLTTTISQNNNILPLRLSRQQKALLAAHWNTKSLRKIVIIDAPLTQARAFLNNITAWDTKLGVGHHWHLISGHLTDQEHSGYVVTDLSYALHALLSKNNTAHDHFVLPASLTTTPLPDPEQYQQEHLVLTLGEEYPLRQLIKKLVDKGYQRHKRNVEPGTFTVKGENIIIGHPYHTDHYTVTLHRHTIEQIIRHGEPQKASPRGERNEIRHRLALPPLGFPTPTTKWAVLLKNSLVIRPAYLSNIVARHTIIDDALHPARKFPSAITAILPEKISSKSQSHSPLSYQRGLELIQALKIERPAVHSDHGIGIYEGLTQRTIDGITREYLVLRYAAGDTLSVPVEYAHKVTAYIGEGTPPINRLSDANWQTVKRKASVSAAHLARELLYLARQRSNAVRARFVVEPTFDEIFDQHQPYILTPDQITAWQDVQSDLTQSSPMDRLIVGDVGFGKTEIAIRAAHLAAANGRQVALLAPTTLLVQQHFDTLTSRLPHLASKITLSSRFSTASQRALTRQGIAQGTISIIVGTHGLLSPRIAWQNLGLVIIDEEQRFGVEQKEYFKKLRASVDILSLSATPIPRTLSLALSGLKTLSIIATPPAGRQDVTVIVDRDNDTVISKALQRELSRGGQVYVVAPRVRQLLPLQERLRALVPNARLAVAHGQMNDQDLAKTMHQFDTGQIDILVSSTIIASGLDLPGANTMIVIDSTHFGLADLYQLRGRIGRRRRQGHVYFLYHALKLTSLQRQRLTALTEAARLGSGWQIARKDLELRGAGNLLGAEQSGAIKGVGLALYLDLVREAAQNEQGQAVPHHEVDIHLPITAAISTDYIRSLTERTRWYQRLTRADTAEQLTTHVQQLKQSYGPLPPETCHLLLLLRLRQVAAQLGLTKISSTTVSPPGKPPFQRLTLQGRNLPGVLANLPPASAWHARGNTLALETDSITPRLVQRILLELKNVRPNTNHKYRQLTIPTAAARHP